MPSVEVNGVRLNYLQMPCESGGQAEDLVLVHGLATNLAFWYFTHAPGFSKRYRVTLYDLRGHGRSETTESGYTAGNMAVDLGQMLDRLGIRRAHFGAHSFGGAVALNLACRNPGRFASLMVFDTHIYEVRRAGNAAWKFGPNIQRILDENRLKIDVKNAYFGYRLLTEVARLKLVNRAMTRDLEDMICALMGKNSSRTASSWLKLIDTTRAEQELMSDDGLSLESLEKLDFPILAVYGELSQAMTTGSRLLNIWPHADFRLIRGAGHFFPVTRPLEFVETCRRFQNGALHHCVLVRENDCRRYFRRSRFYRSAEAWFYDTRESVGNGPFEDIEEARKHGTALYPDIKENSIELHD